jgi:gamma-glutamyl phosphate reductase
MPMEGGCSMSGQGMAMMHEAMVDRIQQVEQRLDQMQRTLDRVAKQPVGDAGSSRSSSGEETWSSPGTGWR